MRTSPIRHAENQALCIIRESYVDICNGDAVAAALLAFFEYWHRIKLEHNTKAARLNDISARAGDGRTQDETLYQFHNSKDLVDGIMGIAKEDTVRTRLRTLVERGFISEHKNPNPKYGFDKTKYFLFHTDAVQAAVDRWAERRARALPVAEDPESDPGNIGDAYPIFPVRTPEDSGMDLHTGNLGDAYPKFPVRSPEFPVRSPEFPERLPKNPERYPKNPGTITETTTEITPETTAENFFSPSPTASGGDVAKNLKPEKKKPKAKTENNPPAAGTAQRTLVHEALADLWQLHVRSQTGKKPANIAAEWDALKKINQELAAADRYVYFGPDEPGTDFVGVVGSNGKGKIGLRYRPDQRSYSADGSTSETAEPFRWQAEFLADPAARDMAKEFALLLRLLPKITQDSRHLSGALTSLRSIFSNWNALWKAVADLMYEEDGIPRGEEFRAQFALFWAEYPKKEGMVAAGRELARALQEPDMPIERILKAVKAYKAQVKREGREERYIRLPAAWLQNKQYYDTPWNAAPPPPAVRRMPVPLADGPAELAQGELLTLTEDWYQGERRALRAGDAVRYINAINTPEGLLLAVKTPNGADYYDIEPGALCRGTQAEAAAA